MDSDSSSDFLESTNPCEPPESTNSSSRESSEFSQPQLNSDSSKIQAHRHALSQEELQNEISVEQRFTSSLLLSQVEQDALGPDNIGFHSRNAKRKPQQDLPIKGIPKEQEWAKIPNGNTSPTSTNTSWDHSSASATFFYQEKAREQNSSASTVVDEKEPYFDRYTRSEVAASNSSIMSGGNWATLGARIGNGSADYHNDNFNSGPSFRRIQNLYVTSNQTSMPFADPTKNQRCPSDTTLNRISNVSSKRLHVYTSQGGKPGPVTIPARSRSAQPSPRHSPTFGNEYDYSMTQRNTKDGHMSAENGSFSRYQHRYSSTTLDNRDLFRNQETDNLFKCDPKKYNSKFENANRESMIWCNKYEDSDGDEPILPSVREIIRQVEALTQKDRESRNASFKRSQSNRSTSGNSGPSNTTNKPMAGILRNSLGRQNSLCAVNGRSSSNSQSSVLIQPVPPVPPHQQNSWNNSFNPVNSQPSTSKPIIGTITRRVDNSTNQMSYVPITTSSKKNDTRSSTLPTDYQKLREAFIEQRKEIQKLRKEILDKDSQIDQLQRDIRLYEPWR